MKFALRDDDTSFFTQPEQLERVYAAHWDRLPVSLAIVPAHAATRSKAIPEEHWQGDGNFPLADNSSLVSYLRDLFQRGRAAPMLHGYDHRNFPGGYEFQVAPDLPGRLRRGRRALEELFDRPIRTFVPPHNALSKRGLEALDAERMNVLGNFPSFRPSQKRWEPATPVNYLRLLAYRLRTRRGRRSRLIYPFPLRYKKHAEFGCHLLLPWTTLEELIAGLEEARRFGGDFCLATHYWEIDDHMAAVLREVVAYAEQLGAHFVPADALFD